jgi:hypothetical protein
MSMLKQFKSLRQDYPAMLSVVVILLGSFVLVGIAYTYTHRPSALIDAASHLFDRRQLPADL